MNHNSTSDPCQKVMTKATYNFLCDTLQEEINMHSHKYELLALMGSQLTDDASFYTQNVKA